MALCKVTGNFAGICYYSLLLFMAQGIAVIGATGMLGKPLTRELIQKGFDVRVIARNTKAARALYPSTTVLQGDVKDADSLTKAFEGIDAVYINLSIKQNERERAWHAEGEGIKNIVAAAKKSGVKRLAYLSSLIINYQGMNDYHWWAFDLKQEAVQRIKESGIAYSIFYPSNFMECFPNLYVQAGRIMLIKGDVQPKWWIAAADYARQVAQSFSILRDENRDYAIQGPEAYTTDDAAAIYAANYTKKKLGISSMSLNFVRTLGLFLPRMYYGAKISEALNLYPESFVSEGTWAELGKPTITLAQYARSL